MPRSVLDALATRLLRLPAATTDYRVTRNVSIPTRDQVMLAADLYEPLTKPAGTLLVRGPYGRGLALSMMLARTYAGRGYRVLFVSSRGTYGSGGEFDPNRTEAADGQDVVAWMREQPWFTGSFATIGASYLGYTQWALLSDPPAELKAAVIGVGPHDFSRHAWGTGAFNLDLIGWSDRIVHQESVTGLTGMLRDATAGRRLGPVLNGLPLADAVDAYFAGRAPWMRYRLTHPDLNDSYWAPMQHAAALERTSIPVLLLSGWQDIFLTQTIEQYTRLRDRGVDVALTIGPWTHLDYMSKAAPTSGRESLDWLDEHLSGRAHRRRSAAARVFVTGTGEWRDLPRWPPDGGTSSLYLRAADGLTEDAPPADETLSEFTFDPAAPTPTLGGPLIVDGGVKDDTALAARSDVLAFTSDPLDSDLEIAGAPGVELAHSTDNPHADLFVRLSEVDARGRSRNVTEAYLRLDPDRDRSAPVKLALRDTAHRFRAGNRIRLLIAGGSHPQYARNLGTGENPALGSTLRPVRHTISFGTSRLLLPVPKR